MKKLDAYESSDARATALIAWLRCFAALRLDAELYDARRSISPDVILELGNHGFFGLQMSLADGGAALDWRSCCRVLQQLGAIDITLAALVIAQNFLSVGTIAQFAQADLRGEWLPKLASGRALAAFALTEPGAGSNPMLLQGTAVLQADGSACLSGTKMFIGNGSWSSILLVFLRCKDQSGRYRGVSGFLVRRDAPGLSIGSELLTVGLRGMVQNVITLDAVHVQADAVLGEHSKGMEVAQQAMQQCRLAMGAVSRGGQKRCLQLMARYATRRTATNTGQLLANPVSLMRIGQLAAMARATDCLLNLITARLDAGAAVPMECFVVCKVLPSEFLWRAVDWAMQMLGGRAYLENNLLPQMWRDARAARILEGPTETMEHHLGSRLWRSGEAVLSFIAEDLNCADISARLSALVDAAAMRLQAAPPPFAGRRSNDLLCSLLGKVLGWAILLAAVRAHRHLQPHHDDERVQRWAAEHLDRAIQRASVGSPEEGCVLTPEYITALTAEYAEDIGDVTYRRAGEAHGLDAYLDTPKHKPLI